MMDVRRNPHRPIRTRRVARQDTFDYRIMANYREVDCIFTSNMLRIIRDNLATPRHESLVHGASRLIPRLRLST